MTNETLKAEMLEDEREEEISEEVQAEEPVPEESSDAEAEIEDLAASYELDLDHVRMAEALLFAAAEPLDLATLADRLPEGVDIPTVLEQLVNDYEGRGVQLIKVANKWAFRTSPDLSPTFVAWISLRLIESLVFKCSSPYSLMFRASPMLEASANFLR